MSIIDSSMAGTVGARDASSLSGTSNTGSEDLGQKDFLTLMTTQLQNQDPFKPMENGDFLAQMAQFSTVAGLETINETLSSMSSEMSSSRIATASSLLGQQVLVPGTLARPDDAGEIHGVVDLPVAADEVKITYLDASSGAALHETDLGAQSAGLVGFDWTGVPDTIKDDRSAVRISVEIQSGGETMVIGPSVYARVTGVQMPSDGSDMTLNIEDYGLRNYMEVSALR